VDDLRQKTLLDIGCGSGLHSLAALTLGAERVISFDYDQDAVDTAKNIRELNWTGDNWTITQGSVLDQDFMANLPKVDFVYSWGVLHQTGGMYQAISNACTPLKQDGVLAIALYSYTLYMNGCLGGGHFPEEWLRIKRRYCHSGEFTRRLMELHYIWESEFSARLPNPLSLLAGVARLAITVANYKKLRGMDYMTDVRDWLGGWPQEFVKEGELLAFSRDKLGLEALDMITGRGNTEFVFRPKGSSNYWDTIQQGQRTETIASPFEKGNGNLWTVRVPHLAGRADRHAYDQRSDICLLEDGMMLPLAHCPIRCIEILGCGRYLHSGESILFSSSDNSDPNQNGRTYTIRY
jgi:SAM-dependent methyltransferase